MVDKELIENWRNMVKLLISSLLFKTNYEGMGEQDKEEFERDFDEILDLALIGLKHKAQLSQEGTTKGTTTDTISRQAAIDSLHMHLMYRMGTDSNKKRLDEWINNLPSAQPEQRWIPCSERMPDVAQRVLLSGHGMVMVGMLHGFSKYSLEPTGMSHIYPKDSIEAWTPLPEPYEGGSTDE